MGVVIDEMEATMEPEPAAQTESRNNGNAASAELSTEKLRRELNRLKEREARLSAD